MDISERIQQLRKAAGYSQEKLAELLHVSRQAISKWESGSTLPTLDNLYELCKIFNISIGELLQPQSPGGSKAAEGNFSPEGLKLYLLDNEQHLAKKERIYQYLTAGIGIAMLITIIGIVVYINRLFDNLNTQVIGLRNQITYVQANQSQYSQGYTYYTPVDEGKLLVSDYDYDISGYDPLTKQITINITATPKTYTEGMSAVFTASAEGQDIVTLDGVISNNNIFGCTMTLPVKDEIKLSISFKTGSEIQSEVLETLYGLKGKYCMKSDSVFNGTHELSGSVLTLKGEVVTSIAPAYSSDKTDVQSLPDSSGKTDISNWPVSAAVQIVIGENSAKEYPIDLSNITDISSSDPPVIINADGSTSTLEGSVFYFYTDIQDDFTVTDNSDVKMIIKITDNYGVEESQTINLP